MHRSLRKQPDPHCISAEMSVWGEPLFGRCYKNPGGVSATRFFITDRESVALKNCIEIAAVGRAVIYVSSIEDMTDICVRRSFSG